MKTIVKSAAILLLAIGFMSAKGPKKTHTVTVSRVIPASAAKVWAVVGEDFGAIAKSHPQIVSSEYINGTLKSGEGAQRVCNFNEDGTKYLHEKQVSYDAAHYTFNVQIFHVDGLPLDPSYGGATYKVEPIDENTSRFVFESEYRTKPAFMGGMFKSKFQKTIADYAIAIEHHVLTGETVNKENFKEIREKYEEQ